jgi:hypothetical protein
MKQGECEDAEFELRCDGAVLHGIFRTHHGTRCLETKCSHFRCTQGKAVNVFHYYSLETGELVDTIRYSKNPLERKR